MYTLTFLDNTEHPCTSTGPSVKAWLNYYKSAFFAVLIKQ
jgi:hypothetical protein